jgi:serine/threonine protein kinase
MSPHTPPSPPTPALPCRNERVNFAQLWPAASAAAVDLVDKMLVFDPTKRITVEEALEHPYLASLHDLSDEPTCSQSVNFDFDSETLTLDVVREVRDACCSL